VAIVSFETPSQAAQAKGQFDGKLAKGMGSNPQVFAISQSSVLIFVRTTYGNCIRHRTAPYSIKQYAGIVDILALEQD
jgi:hypothetical protein